MNRNHSFARSLHIFMRVCARTHLLVRAQQTPSPRTRTGNGTGQGQRTQPRFVPPARLLPRGGPGPTPMARSSPESQGGRRSGGMGVTAPRTVLTHVLGSSFPCGTPCVAAGADVPPCGTDGSHRGVEQRAPRGGPSGACRRSKEETGLWEWKYRLVGGSLAFGWPSLDSPTHFPSPTLGPSPPYCRTKRWFVSRRSSSPSSRWSAKTAPPAQCRVSRSLPAARTARTPAARDPSRPARRLSPCVCAGALHCAGRGV